MRTERIKKHFHPLYNQAIQLYKMSFPYHEQRELLSQNKILEDDDYHFCLVYDNDIFVGLVLYWKNNSFIYIEHFCIFPDMRNKQYGQKTLQLLEQLGKTIILEIDPPIDDISKRRKSFYQRCGFVQNEYIHTHPPYHQQNSGHNLILMTYPRPIEQDMYDDFENFLNNRVMKDAVSV